MRHVRQLLGLAWTAGSGAGIGTYSSGCSADGGIVSMLGMVGAGMDGCGTGTGTATGMGAAGRGTGAVLTGAT